MKIAIVSPYDFTWPGGVTNHISHLAHRFTTMGHQVKILTPHSPARNMPTNGDFIPLGRSVPIPTGGSIARISLSVWLYRRIRDLLAQEAFDVVHLHEPLAPFLPICVLQCSTSLNVGTFHAFHGSHRAYRISHPLLKLWYKKLDGRIAVSQAAHQHASRFFPGEYHIIPNGIDLEHFAGDVTPITELKDGKTNILFVGRLEKRKGLRYLLEAFAQLKWEFPNTRLIVVGPGNPDKDCYRVLSERNLQDVVFVGPVSYDQLARYYHTADIFCSPATGKESFGIVLLEAMASGTPIVATDIEGYSALLDGGEYGLVVPPRDSSTLAEALALLIRQPEVAQQMTEKAREAVEKYSWGKVAQRVMDYYLSLLEEGRGTAGQREA